MNEVLDLICFCCRNHNCDNYTIYRGYLICEYCLDDWLPESQKGLPQDFESWCIQHNEELKEELTKKRR